jgi:hypothetical protein
MGETQDITSTDVRRLIAEVFEHHPLPALERVETAAGLIVRFVVTSPRLGGVLCEYPVEPMAKALLQLYQNVRFAAYSMLVVTLVRLPEGLHLGMENVADTAELETVEAEARMRALMRNGGKPVESKQRRARRKETLKKMDARARKLVAPLKRGPEADVTPEIIVGAVGILADKGKLGAEITPQAVAILLNCSDRVIYKALENNNVTFERILQFYPALNS